MRFRRAAKIAFAIAATALCVWLWGTFHYFSPGNLMSDAVREEMFSALPPPSLPVSQNPFDTEQIAGQPAPTQNTPDFEPWPPPRPTDFRNLNDLFSDRTRYRRLADIQNYFETSLDSVGIDDFSYFNAPGGFALVTPIERLGSNGTPEFNSLHDSQHDETGDWFRNWLLLLFWCPKGYYGAVVFFVTTDMRGPDMKESVTQDELENWSIGGVRDLPENIKNASVGGHYIYAAVYNFVRNDEDSPVLLSSNIFDTDRQLSALGIFSKNAADH